MQSLRLHGGAVLLMSVALCVAVASTALVRAADTGPGSEWPPRLMLDRALEQLDPTLALAKPNDPTRPTEATEPTGTTSQADKLKLHRPSSLHGTSPAGPLTTSAWKTAGVLAAICLAVVVVARLLRRGGRGLWLGGLPVEVIEVLGRRSLDGRHAIQLVRCGSRVLVLSVDAAGGLSTLAEITDPGEVEQMIDLCRPDRNRPPPVGERVDDAQRAVTAPVQERVNA